jgi:hypothetical protein
MTVSSTTTKNSYSGNGSTTTFAYGFKIFANTDLTVILRSALGAETVQTLTTHYTVSNVGVDGGGNVVFVAAPASGVTVVIRRNMALTQSTDYVANDPFPAATHEDALDRLTFISQQIQEEVNRSIKLSRTNTMTSTEFTTSAADRANKILAFDTSGELAVTQELGTYKGTDTTTTTAAYTVRDIIKSTTAGQLNNVYICIANSVIGDTLTDTDHFELLVDAYSAASSAAAAASSATDAQTAQTAAELAETNAETAETNAETAETNAAASEANAATSESNAATSESNASTSESNASTSASTATTQAGIATTQAGNASTSASNAATSESNAGTSESNAATSESNAGTSESNAATSASNAATSESNAATSETNAAASAAAAAASADTFDDTYLGSKSSDPSVDNDGDALNAGDLYFNTTSNTLKVYTGSAWQDAAIDSSGFVQTTGDTMTGALVLNSNLSANGGAVFNEGGADVDFRVESDTLTHALFVDGASGGVGIGTATPTSSWVSANNLVISDTSSDGGMAIISSTSGNGNIMFSDATAGAFSDARGLISYIHASDAMRFMTANAERMRIDSSGNVGIGVVPEAWQSTRSALQVGDSTAVWGDGSKNSWFTNNVYRNSSNNEVYINASYASEITMTNGGIINFKVAPSGSADATIGWTTAMTIDNSGNVGIGTSSPAGKLSISNGTIFVGSEANTTQTNNLLNGYGYRLGATLYGSVGIRSSYNSGTNQASLEFYTEATERMRIDSSGNVLVGTTNGTPAQSNIAGGLSFSTAGLLEVSANNTQALFLNRTTDGELVLFIHEGSAEGSISVSGSTVSYNGGHLSRWSQLTDNTRDNTIVKGTVMTNLDQMAEWTTDGVTEDNEQLNKMAVSSVEGDANVAGVFVNWDNDDDVYTNDMNVAMTGDMVIRIAQGTTVARGDLLMSAGDGTAKTQGDDIVRSKTIAKVTSTNVSHTYDDGTYLVPCVLMAC